MTTFIQALTLYLAPEGGAFALFQQAMRRAMPEASDFPDQQLLRLGFAALTCAVFIATGLRCRSGVFPPSAD